MVNDQVEADVDEVHLLDLVMELRPLQHLQCITIDVEGSVGLNLSVAALHQRFLLSSDWPRTEFLMIKSFDFFFPLALDYLDHIAFILWFEDRQLNFYWTITDNYMGLLGIIGHGWMSFLEAK